MGGQRPEPKTDIIFRKNGVKHRCSLKYGGRFQLSSAGIESTVKVMNDVLTKVSFSGGLGGLQVKKVASVLSELSKFPGPKRQEKPIMDRLMREAKKEGGIRNAARYTRVKKNARWIKSISNIQGRVSQGSIDR